MGQSPKNHSKEFKAKVALEAVKGIHTLSELSSRYKVHSTQIKRWKKLVVDNAPQLFDSGNSRTTVNVEELTAPLYEEIGRLKMEVNFLQKKR